MSTQSPFPLDDDMAVHLLKRNTKDQRPVWERYTSPYHTDPQPDEWPHTVECFAE
jgi:hypothetical protein